MSDQPIIASVDASVHRFPTEYPEADGTLQWDATTAVAVRLYADGYVGLGWTYSSPAAASVIENHLTSTIVGSAAFDIEAGWTAMHRAGRNLGTRGLYMQAMSAVDIAWWDLKARLLELPLVTLLGRCRERVPIYGSGGFTTQTDHELARQVEQWRRIGCSAVKIKIGESRGTRVDRDLRRVSYLRELTGPDVDLMVDANGGYTVGQACRMGSRLDALGVRWFEEPVSSDDIAGLQTVRRWVSCDVAAGEYAADVYDVRALVPAVDCLQLDATRCGGYTGWIACASLARAHNLEVSGHCAPALHAFIAQATPNLRHVEYFADHARLEPQLVDGAPSVVDGHLDASAAELGHGMTLNSSDE